MNKGLAICLVSGGLDSATAMAIAKSMGFSIHAVTVSYGQRHSIEMQMASKTCEHIGVLSHSVVNVNIGMFGGSSLTGNLPVPKNRGEAEISSGIPNTYVPARNLVMLSVAMSCAEANRSSDIFIGVNAVDYSGYPDCRPEFIESFERTARLATKAGVSGEEINIHAPLISLKKHEIIRAGLDLGVDYSKTITCYDPDSDGLSCGECDACKIRLAAFRELEIKDPAGYRNVL